MNEFCFPRDATAITPLAMNPLELAAQRHGTDKQYAQHGYTYYYHLFLRHMRDQPVRLLEFGVLKGASLRMWREYFPKGTIVGVDIDPECLKQAGPGIDVLQGDEAQPRLLTVELKKRYPEGFDIIVDDGSHIASNQQNLLMWVFPLLRSGGVYAIEDLAENYSVRGNTMVEELKRITDEIHMRGEAGGNINRSLAKLGKKASWWSQNLAFMFTAKELCILGRR